MKLYSQKSGSIKIFCCFIFVLLFCICFMGMSHQVKAEVIAYCVEIPRDDFPVRSEPLDSSQVLISLPEGSLLYPESVTGSWYKVPFSDGVYGYVHKAYVTEITAQAEVATFPGEAFQEGASEGSSTISICSKNTEVTISGRDGQWCLVTPYNSSYTGYMKESALSVKNKVIYNTVDNEKPGSYLTVVASSANIRSNPGTSFGVVEKVSYGAQLTSLGTVSGADGYTWYYVKTSSDNRGYIRSDLVTPLTIGGGLAGKTIVVDPGHGSHKTSDAGLDVGAVGPSKVREKDVNLKIAMYLKGYLEADGAKVIMTRTSDVGLMTLTDRANVANNNGADLFISIHCNSATDQSAHGTETYYSTVDEYKVAIGDALRQQRSSVASSVQRNLVSQLGLRNRGVKTSNFTVITKTKMPSILVETAFISNPTEERMLNSASVQDSAAKGCYLGIREFFN